MLRDDKGGVAIPFALMTIVLMTCVALAVDYARILRTQTQLQAALDGAMLAAAMSPNPDFSKVEAVADAYVKAARINDAATQTVALSLSPDGRSMTGTLQARVETRFAGVVNIPFVDVAVTSTAGRQGSYTDVHLILDVSESLGLAASATEIAQLKALTKPYTDVFPDGHWLKAENGCAFACHFRSGDGFEPPGKTVKDIARENNIKLRWDVMFDASSKLAQTLMTPTAAYKPTGFLRMGVHAFDSQSRTLLAPHDNLATVELAITQTEAEMRAHDTRFDDSMPDLAWTVGAAGDGYSASAPRKIAIIVTDGLKTAFHSTGRDQGVLDASHCQRFKDNGVTVAVINISYFYDSSSPAFMYSIAPMHHEIEPALRACASGPALYFEGSDTPTIQKAFSDLATTLVRRTLRLTH